MSGGDALSALPNQRLLEGGKTYLLRYLGVRRAAEWHNHLAPVGIRVLLANVDELQLRGVECGESHSFERDVRVPSVFPTLPFLARDQERSFVELLGLARTDDADLVISSASVAARIYDGMDMQLGRCWFAGKLAKALGEFFLECVI